VRARLAAALVAALAAGRPALAQPPPAAHHEVPVEAPLAEQPAVPPGELPPGIARDYDRYLLFKEGLQNTYGLQYAIEVSALPQWAGTSATNFVYTPWIRWTPFTDTALGSGAFVFSFQQNGFGPGADPTALQTHAGLLTPASDWGGNLADLAQLTYTHTLPGRWRWLSVTLGQYSFGLYDQNEYAGNAQSNFVNYALAQNATQTYVSGDLGAYAQAAAPDRKWVLAGGFQGATNLTGSGLSVRGIATGKLAYFMAAQSTPGVLGGSYGFLWYTRPATPAQPSPSRGISFNAVHNINPKLGLFLRVNHAGGRDSAIATSLAWGVVVNGPLAHRPFDRLGLGFAWNKTNPQAVDLPARNSEFVAEIYYNYAVF
jgi:hypothetical protein